MPFRGLHSQTPRPDTQLYLFATLLDGVVGLEDMMVHARTGEQTAAKRLVSLERQGNPSMVKARRAPTPLWYNLIL